MQNAEAAHSVWEQDAGLCDCQVEARADVLSDLSVLRCSE